MRAAVIIAALLLLWVAGPSVHGGETAVATHEISHDDSIRIVPFSQPTWFGERIRDAIRIWDVFAIGHDRYRYRGTVKVDSTAYHADFSKKLRWVLLYHQRYYFICQDYFGWNNKFDFYAIPSDQNHGNLPKIPLAEVPDEILKYQFPADDIDFICKYQSGVLWQLFENKDYGRMIRLLHDYAGVSPYAGALANNIYFDRIYLQRIRWALNSGTFPVEYKRSFFEEFKLFFPELLKMDSLNNTVADIAECLVCSSPEEGDRIVAQFLEQYSALQQPALTEEQLGERKGLISDLKSILERNQERMKSQQNK